MNANIAGILTAAAAAHGARPALLHDGEAISYSELEQRAGAVAALLTRRGVQPGDRVAIRLPNSPAFVAAYFGALQVGAIVVPLNMLLAAPEVAQRLTAAGAELVLSEEAELEGASASLVADRGADDPAVLLFTSGTSGQPKAVVITHGSLREAAANAAAALGLGTDDVVLGAAPFAHVLGQSTGLVATFMAGAAVAIVPRFEAERTLELMTETGTTLLVGVPSMAIALCEAARSASALPPLRLAHLGGAAVPPGLADEVERRFAGASVYEGYGLTELSGIATTTPLGEPRKPGSVGRPLGQTELRIVPITDEIGEIELRGPSVAPHYWDGTITTDHDGWLSTGDLGYVDEDGYLFLVDRKNELILRGGYNVYPREVEDVLTAHPDVIEAAVVGVPHASLGEEVAAFVVLRDGAEPDADAMRDYTRAQVAAYKYPRHIVFLDALPKGPTGKILKRALPEALSPERSSR